MGKSSENETEKPKLSKYKKNFITAGQDVHIVAKQISKKDDTKKVATKNVKFNLSHNEQFEIEPRPKKELKLSNNIEQSSTNRSWNQSQEEKQTGKFSEDEAQTLKAALCKYVFEKGIGEKGLIKLVSEKASQETFGAWTEIAECLPYRTVQSCHNFCRRRFNPNNYGGKWSEEEINQLVALVKEHGRKWKMIGEILGRTEVNARDKYRNIGEENTSQRDKFWNVKELQKLVQYIGHEVGLKLLKNRKEMKQQITEKGEEMNEQSLNSGSHTKRIRNMDNIDANTKFIVQYINYDNLKQLQNVSIPWTNIADKMNNKSRDDCKNKWEQQLLKAVYEYSGNYEEEDEEDLIQQIVDQDIDQESDINFNLIKNNKTPLENKMKWNILKKRVTSRSNVTVPSILKQLLSQIKESKHIKPSDIALQTQNNELIQFYRKKYE